MTVKTRFAPSPTGMLHIGGARTALYAWLHARHHGGQFVLRIEDTDKERSTDEATQVILDGLKWLGLNWDEAPTFQAERIEKHKQAVQQLINNDLAYRCYCSREELDDMREAQRAAGQKPMYDGRCRHRHDEKTDQPFVIRFRSPTDGETIVDDQVLGAVHFQNKEIDDLILMRSDGSPTYNLAVVVDDADMGISHVIRGSDHLNNTPRQIQLYQALNLTIPTFAHIPLIHGADGAKMSKRHGAVAITDYKKQGYLPDAVVNYLVRLGWSHGDEEIFSRQQLIELFDVAQVGKSASRFDTQKLDWLNAHYLHTSSANALCDVVQEQLDFSTSTGPELTQVIAALQERSKNILDLAAQATMFYQAPASYDAKAVKKNFKEGTTAFVESYIEQAQRLPEWEKEALHQLISTTCEKFEIKMGKLAQPLRILLAGVPVSPPIDLTLSLLGREESLQRLKQGLAQLSNAS
ncbi:MAG: glutamate--tRNA ligase [Mariprofundaceae bacterium]|nr:glutamate--tRNA ligase [Mariprofundaceae bacterium]